MKSSKMESVWVSINYFIFISIVIVNSSSFMPILNFSIIIYINISISLYFYRFCNISFNIFTRFSNFFYFSCFFIFLFFNVCGSGFTTKASGSAGKLWPRTENSSIPSWKLSMIPAMALPLPKPILLLSCWKTTIPYFRNTTNGSSMVWN